MNETRVVLPLVDCSFPKLFYLVATGLKYAYQICIF